MQASGNDFIAGNDVAFAWKTIACFTELVTKAEYRRSENPVGAAGNRGAKVCNALGRDVKGLSGEQRVKCRLGDESWRRKIALAYYGGSGVYLPRVADNLPDTARRRLYRPLAQA